MTLDVAAADPLHDLHEQAEAEFQPYAAWQIVSTFGEPQAEYAALRKGAGLMDLPQRGFLELTGKDRLPFLNNLITNQTYDKATKTGLAAGQGVYAFLLQAKNGRVIADMTVLELGDRTLIELDGRLAGDVAAALERYKFAEQVTITNRTGQLHEIALHGPRATVAMHELPALEATACATIDLFGAPAVVWRDDPTGAAGFHLVVPSQSARVVWMNAIGRHVRPVGWAAFNAARVEAGRPLFGIDFDDTALPAETGPLLDRAVSFTKGCYPGQEIVARMHARQQVAKRIVGLKMADDNLPMAGAPLTDDGGDTVGGVTSSTVSPLLSNLAVALATVKKGSFAAGTVLTVPAEGAMRRAVVVDLPLVPATVTAPKEPA
jgi:folate-binding protein YgfZ